MQTREILKHVINNDLSEAWQLLSHAEKRLITDNFLVHSYKRNQIIYAEKEEPEYMYCLLRGKVKMYKIGIGERVQILRLYRPVQYFGYRAFFANELYVSSAAAFEPAIVGSIPMNIIDKLIRSNNNVALFFIHELSRNLGGSDTKIVNLTQKHIRGRLAEALLLLVDNYGYETDDTTLKIYLSREDLANLSNMTTSNAIRTLTGFVKEKLIVVDGRRIRILNESMLRKISKFG